MRTSPSPRRRAAPSIAVCAVSLTSLYKEAVTYGCAAISLTATVSAQADQLGKR
jgi:hypothetical protein